MTEQSPTPLPVPPMLTPRRPDWGLVVAMAVVVLAGMAGASAVIHASPLERGKGAEIL